MALLTIVFGSLSCASSHAPVGMLEEPEDVPRSGYGGWVEIRLRGEKSSSVEGELLGVGAESVYVLTNTGFQSVSMQGVQWARVEAFRSQTGSAVAMTTVGTLLSLGHGIGFIISGPIWIIAGSTGAGAVSREPLHPIESGTWKSVSNYARFPQGLPAGLDRTSLRPRETQTERSLAVLLDSGELLAVRRIQVSHAGYVKVELVDRSERSFNANRIRSVTNRFGEDVTKKVLAGETTRP